MVLFSLKEYTDGPKTAQVHMIASWAESSPSHHSVMGPNSAPFLLTVTISFLDVFSYILVKVRMHLHITMPFLFNAQNQMKSNPNVLHMGFPTGFHISGDVIFVSAIGMKKLPYQTLPRAVGR